jgi:lycopene beta-cyclase
LRTDLLIVGGGLAGSLVALALNARRPDVAVTLVEAGETLGGNHIWSFFDSDVAPDDRALVAPLVAHHWPGNEIAFPRLRRSFASPYNSIESERLDPAIRAALPVDSVLTATRVAALDPAGARLADGRRIEAAGVIDARGFAADAPLDLGWQKFVGRLLRLDRPHGLDRPTIMDATVEQQDGYRFVYLLPFDDHRLFVEDTYYSDDRALDVPCLAGRIDAYAAARGWTIAAVEREEAAALPIAMGGDFEALWRGDGAGVAKVGMAAGLFHPTTGYSLPDAVRTASFIAALPDLGSAALEPALHAFARARWRERGFYRLLARMLFRAAEPAERWRILARFYALDEGLIGRFYAGRSTLFDKARIVLGKPPVPIGRALGVLRG